MPDSLPPHELQHARPPCPLPAPGVHPNPCPLSRRCHPTIFHLILCCPLLLLPSIFPSIRVFSNESALHIRWQGIGVSASALHIRWQGIGISASKSVLPGLISFRMDWLDLLAVQGTLKSLQHHSSKA